MESDEDIVDEELDELQKNGSKNITNSDSNDNCKPIKANEGNASLNKTNLHKKNENNTNLHKNDNNDNTTDEKNNLNTKTPPKDQNVKNSDKNDDVTDNNAGFCLVAFQ